MKGSAVTYDEKNSWVFLLTAVVGYATYLILLAVFGAGAYVPLLLSTVGGAIAVNIVASIAISATNGRDRGKRDQRDREVHAFGERIGGSFVVLGAVAALVLALFEAPWFWIANAVYLAFALSAIVGASARLAAYRRGMPAW
jgi:branched-subunit amino acid ABC-type transport system permease component